MSLNVSLTPSLEGFVREKVAQGEYDSASEVLREALRLLKRREELWKAEVQEKIEKGMASLRAGRVIPAEEVWAKLERAVATAEKRRGPRRK
jgi:antitoxin ParD1/3/4